MLNNAPMLASIPEGARAEHVAKYNAPVLASTPDGARVEYMAKYKLVDNCVWSVPTVQNFGRLVPELTRLLARRGLCLEKFILSNAPVLASIPDGARAEYMVKYKAPMLAGIPEGARAKRMAKYKLGNDLPQKCVLGMALDLAPDVLRFDVKPINKSMTRRGMLSDMSSVFDPLRPVALVLLLVRVLLQELLNENRGWDEQVP